MDERAEGEERFRGRRGVAGRSVWRGWQRMVDLARKRELSEETWSDPESDLRPLKRKEVCERLPELRRLGIVDFKRVLQGRWPSHSFETL